MRILFNNIVSVIHSFIRFAFLKLVNFKGVHVNVLQRFSPNVVVEVNGGGQIFIGEKVRVHSGSKIKVRKGGKLVIGSGVKFNYGCIVACKKDISIGDGTEFGPYVLVYDHDHDYKSGLKNDFYKETPVKIGKNCWIGAGTIILSGTILGDNCVIGAGSVVRGCIPSNSLFVQKREETITSF